MDIKKFINSNKIDNDYNKSIQMELDMIKNINSHDDINIINRHIHKLSDCDFFKLSANIDVIINDKNIVDFKNLCVDNMSYKLAFSGPMIKKNLDPNVTNKNVKYKNHYIVTVYNATIKAKNILKDITKIDYQNAKDYIVIKTYDSTFYLSNIVYSGLIHVLLANENAIDRIILAENDIWVSNMFILELYKHMLYFSEKILDPVFNYPEDIFNIYDRSRINNRGIKQYIDMADLQALSAINKKDIENTVIIYNDQKYTSLEYMLVKLMECSHPMIIYQMRNIIIYYSAYIFQRPIFFVAKMIGFDKKYPGIYDSLTEKSHNIDINDDIDIIPLKTTYHIDMYIVNHLIKHDNVDLFTKYISQMMIVKKFKQISKTADKIVEWLIEHKAFKIINMMIDCSVLSDYYKYRIIFLTQEFNFLGQEFIEKYVLKKFDNIDYPSNEPNRVIITKKIVIDDNNDETNEKDGLCKKQQELILSNLPDIINRGYSRSFFVICKICPYILENDYINEHRIDGNLLHTLKSDSSEIAEIIIKLNPKLIDDKDSYGRTPLILYSELGLTNCIYKLMDYNSNYEIVDNTGETFLHKLCKKGHLDALRGIIRKVTNIIDVKNNNMQTSAILAAIGGHEDIFYLLKGLNANLDIKDAYGNSVYHYICKSKICPGIMINNHKNKFGFTPMDYSTVYHEFYYFI